MAVNAKLICILEMISLGTPTIGKQGASINDWQQWLNTSVDGITHERKASIGTNSAATLYDATSSGDDLPATFDLLFFWSDQSVHLQLIESTTPTHVVLPTLATFPFIMGDGDMLAAANSTAITNASSTLRALDKIVCGNAAAGTAECLLILIT